MTRKKPEPTGQRFWTAVFSGETWEEFLEAGGETAGFREKKWGMVSKIRQGDILLAYVTGISRWIGVLEATGSPFESKDRIWVSDDYPCRAPVRVAVALEFETAIPVTSMRDDLELFQGLANPHAWSWHFYTAPKELSEHDGRAVRAAIERAAKRPKRVPFDESKLQRRPEH